MNMDKDDLKLYFCIISLVIIAILTIVGAAYVVISLIEYDDTDDAWSDFADKSNRYTDYTIEKYKGYESGVNASTTSAHIVFISEGMFSVYVEKEANVIKWYYLYADDNGIRIEYHTMYYSSVMYSVDKIISIRYIPYDAIRYVFVNNLPSEY